MKFKHGLRILAVASLVLAAGKAAAQSTATVSGRVTDANGGPVAGAQIVVSNLTTGTQSGALSGADGTYTVTGLRAGGP